MTTISQKGAKITTMISFRSLSCALSWALPLVFAIVGVSHATDLPEFFEIAMMSIDERDTAIEKICNGASQRDLPLLFEIADSPTMAGRHLGAIAALLALYSTPSEMERAEALATSEILFYAGVFGPEKSS